MGVGKKKPTANRRSLLQQRQISIRPCSQKGRALVQPPLRPSPAANPKLLGAYFLPQQPAARQDLSMHWPLRRPVASATCCSVPIRQNTGFVYIY